MTIRKEIELIGKNAEKFKKTFIEVGYRYRYKNAIILIFDSPLNIFYLSLTIKNERIDLSDEEISYLKKYFKPIFEKDIEIEKKKDELKQQKLLESVKF